MTTVSFNAAANCYFAFNVSTDDAINLSKLQWRPHPDDPTKTWWTRSPYLAAPLWHRVANEDVETKTALNWYAWNYITSFAKEPLVGTGVDTIRIPVGMKPYPFQVAGVQRAVLRKKMLLGDEQGCGKTPQAMTLANMVRPERILIGCPAGIMFNIAKECENWLVDPRSISILDNPRKPVPDRGIIILPYSRGHSFVEKILRGPRIDLLIMDEVHFAKNPNAMRTAPWFGLGGFVERAERALIMTGTPIPNNPLEIHSALQAIAPDTIGAVSRDGFKQLYCNTYNGTKQIARKSGGTASVSFETNSSKDEAVLNAELRASGVMVRRHTADVLDQLPPKHVFLMHLTPTAEIEALVREEASLYDMLETRILPAKELMVIQGHIARVRHQLGVLKAPKVAEYVRSIFEGGEKRVVLFMLHREAMEAVRKAFEHTQVKVRMLTGNESPKVRQAHVDAFQTPGGYELIIGQVVAAGVGLTMTAARYCVLGEISWTPAVNDQAWGRVHRATQTRQTEIAICSFPHAVEERVIRANAKKAISAYNILDKNLMELFGAAA